MDDQLKILRELSKDETLSQRDLSKKLGLSLGKVNYVLNALINKGHVKAERFKNSKNKAAYMYILTPQGMTKKMELTYFFLNRKLHEYNALKKEIKELKEYIKKEAKNENSQVSHIKTKEDLEMLNKLSLTD